MEQSTCCRLCDVNTPFEQQIVIMPWNHVLCFPCMIESQAGAIYNPPLKCPFGILKSTNITDMASMLIGGEEEIFGTSLGTCTRTKRIGPRENIVWENSEWVYPGLRKCPGQGERKTCENLQWNWGSSFIAEKGAPKAMWWALLSWNSGSQFIGGPST